MQKTSPGAGVAHSGRKCIVVITTIGLLATTLPAERAPRSPNELVKASDLVVVGRIVDLQIQTERSHIETSFGNYDWAIDLTLQIEKVEKGESSGDTIVARCFRIKSRKSAVEYMTPSGNRPIPAVGTPVRAHLYERDQVWRVVFPNGLGGPRGEKQLTDAEAVRQLEGGGYTYWLPLEIWVVIGAVLILPLLLGWVIRHLWRRVRQQPSSPLQDK
jgi:hypothetical protein